MPGKGADRNAWWDWLRFVAFIDIAGFHLRLQHPLLGIGLPLFLMLALVFAARDADRQPFARFMSVRLHRLLIPFVFWSLAFGSLMLAVALRRGWDVSKVFHWPMLVSGVQVHQWFLVFIVLAGVLVYWTDRLTCRLPAAGVVGASLAASLYLGWLDPLARAVHPFNAWGFSLAVLPLSLAVGRILRDAGGFAPARMRLLLLLAAFSAVSLVLWFTGQWTDTLQRHHVAFVLLVAVLFLPTIKERISPWLAAHLFGAYVLHETFAQQFGYKGQRYVADPMLAWGLEIAAVAGLAFFFTWLLRLTPLRRVL